MSLRLLTAKPSFLIELDGSIVNIATLSRESATSLRDHLRQVQREEDALKVDAVLSYAYSRVADSTIADGRQIRFLVLDSDMLARESAYLIFIASAQRYTFVVKHEGERVAVEAYAIKPKGIGQPAGLRLVWWVSAQIAPAPVLPEL